MSKLKNCDDGILYRFRNRQSDVRERMKIFKDDFIVDVEVFRKTPDEKLLLKILKSESKRRK